MATLYWETAGYGVEFRMEQYGRMVAFPLTIKGKAVISLNDHPDTGYALRSIPRAFCCRYRLKRSALQATVW
jgi:hypothetical protein